MHPRSRSLPFAVLFFAASALVASAQITFNFTYQDVVNDTNAGFDDATLGATRRAALESAASHLVSYLAYPGSPRTVNFTVATSVDSGGFLAHAGSSSFANDGAFQPSFVQQMIMTGNNSGQPSLGSMTWNFGSVDYYYGTDSNPGFSQYDFRSVAMHELTHALGFASYLNDDGTGLGGSTTTWSLFDQFLTDASGTRLVTSEGVFSGVALLTNEVSSDIFFSGANAMAANGGQRVQIYSPKDFEDGSSLSHIGTGAGGDLMSYALYNGAAFEGLSAVDIGILMDLGYSMAAVPEPATVGLFLGLGALGFVSWRRRRTA